MNMEMLKLAFLWASVSQKAILSDFSSQFIEYICLLVANIITDLFFAPYYLTPGLP